MSLCIIQARLGSKRFPNKVMQTVGGIPMVKRVWLAAKGSRVDKVIVAWPERYPYLDQNDVLERFRRIIEEYRPKLVVRLTADCPLLTSQDIDTALNNYNGWYYSNHIDGHDVQVFNPAMLWTDEADNEHVIADFTTKSTGLSVNTKKDLQRVRRLCKIK